MTYNHHRHEHDQQETSGSDFMFPTKKVAIAITSLIALVILFSSFYTVPEGHIGIVNKFGKAVRQEEPGLHFKVPLIETVREIEVRTRKNEESMLSSTNEQMPITTAISVNWLVEKEFALDLYIQYGGLAQFEARILDPRFRSVAKEVFPQFTAEELIQDRSGATRKIEAQLTEEMAEYPISVSNIQIENISLPQKYLKSIETKQTEKNLAAAEEHKLERQRLEALREVNTADASAQAIVKVAQAEATATKLRGEAEAYAIDKRAEALGENPLLIELTEAERWNGALPTTVLGGSSALPIFHTNNKE